MADYCFGLCCLVVFLFGVETWEFSAHFEQAPSLSYTLSSQVCLSSCLYSSCILVNLSPLLRLYWCHLFMTLSNYKFYNHTMVTLLLQSGSRMWIGLCVSAYCFCLCSIIFLKCSNLNGKFLFKIGRKERHRWP